MHTLPNHQLSSNSMYKYKNFIQNDSEVSLTKRTPVPNGREEQCPTEMWRLQEQNVIVQIFYLCPINMVPLMDLVGRIA